MEGIIFPMNVHLFLLEGVGTSVLSFGSSLIIWGVEDPSAGLRLEIVVGDAIIPSKPTNKLAAGN